MTREATPPPLEEDKHIPSYPIQNFNYHSHRSIPYLAPSHDLHLIEAEYKISQRLASVRDRERTHGPIFTVAAIATAVMFKRKNPYASTMLFPLSLLGTSWMYHRSLAYGDMIPRVMVEAHQLLHDRDYTLTAEQYKDITQQIEAYETPFYESLVKQIEEERDNRTNDQEEI